MKIVSWIPFLLLLLFPSYPLGALDISPKELPWRASELTDPRRELDGLAAKAEEMKNAELAIAVALAAIATGENPYRVIPRCRFAAPLKVAQLRQIYDFLQTGEDLRTADDIRKELGTVQDLSPAWQRFIRAREEGGEDEADFAEGLRAAAELDTNEVIFQELRLLHDPAAATAEAELFFQNHKAYPPRVRAMLEELVEAERLTAAVALVAQLPLNDTDVVALQATTHAQIELQVAEQKTMIWRQQTRRIHPIHPFFSPKNPWFDIRPFADFCLIGCGGTTVRIVDPLPQTPEEILLSIIRWQFQLSQQLPLPEIAKIWAEKFIEVADMLDTGSMAAGIPWQCASHPIDYRLPLPDIAAAYLELGNLEGARRMALVHLGDGKFAPLCFHEQYARRDFDLLLPGLLALGMPDSPAVPELARRYRLGVERLKAGDGFSARRHFRRTLRKDKDLATLRHLLLEANSGTLNTEH